jgi:hypothetical protein
MGWWHIALHIAVPGAIARIGFRERWLRAWLIMVATMIVDVDHLLADPIYEPGRCSIGYHPLHTAPAILAYSALAFVPKTQLVGLGLVIHMALDALDCVMMAF